VRWSQWKRTQGNINDSLDPPVGPDRGNLSPEQQPAVMQQLRGVLLR
jgi:hypothetical protein